MVLRDSIALNTISYMIFLEYNTPESILELNSKERNELLKILVGGDAPSVFVNLVASILGKEVDYEPVIYDWSLFIN